MSRKRWDERRSTLQENHMAYVSELQQDFERKLTEDKNRRANLEAQRETLRKEHLEARSQLDDDIDVEVKCTLNPCFVRAQHCHPSSFVFVPP